MTLTKLYQRLLGKSTTEAGNQSADAGNLPPLTPLSAVDLANTIEHSDDGSDDEWADRLSDGFMLDMDEEAA